MASLDRPSRLPPLNFLRGFEAAARHSSFVKAADELALTQSAVSHQIRQLEAFLGQRLFQRQAREVTLTDAGRDFLETVRSALGLLTVGVARLAPYRDTGPRVVSCDAAFARFWLLPRLALFRKAHPDIELWLDTTERLLDFDRQEVEIVMGRLRSTGGDAAEEILLDDFIAPALRPPAGPTKAHLGLKELAGQTLIHDERRENWLVWLTAQSLKGVDVSAGPHFSDPGLALDAARAGHGIALVSRILAADDLAAGKLVAPFDGWLRIPGEYRIAYPRWLKEDAAMMRFVAFIRDEARESLERLAALESPP